MVYQAKLCETGEMVAIKKVLQDKRFAFLIVYLLKKHFTLENSCFEKKFRVGTFQLMSVAEVNLKISSKAWSKKFVKQ